jgi:cytosine/adenosine deaminase-related metal-dependent hydrolase
MSAVTDQFSVGPDARGRVVRVTGSRISAVEGGDRAAEVATGDSSPTLLPGRVNCHTHIYSGLAPLGMPPPDDPPENFVEILERVWWILDRALDEASLHAAARYYVANALLAGTTSLIDHHESPDFIEGSLDVIADACEELGMRAVLTFGATERNGGREEARRGLAECRRFIESNGHSLVEGVVGLHASFTVSDETIREAAMLCRDLDTVMHVHVAEDGSDVLDAQKRGYPGPLERLLDLEALPPGSIIAHGVHLAADQVRRAADSGVWIVQNPRSNRGNGVGYPPALAISNLVALGTDGYPAVLEDEAQVLREEAALRREPQAAVESRIDSGHALLAGFFDGEFAPLGEGANADLALVGEGSAREVLVGGRQVVAAGALMTADLDLIRTEAASEAARLWKRMADIRRAATA